MNAGIVIRKEDAVTRGKAAKCGVSVEVRQDWALPWPNTLFIAPGTSAPWDLIAIGFGFLARWDVATPLWQYGALAANVGTREEQRRTEAIVRDLRIPVYAHELLFVRNSPDGRALLAAWQEEMVGGGEARLAFVRAVYRVKPLFLALPRAWLGKRMERRAQRPIRRPVRRQVQRSAGRQAQHSRRDNLVRVQIARGRYVRCKPGEEEKTLKRWQKLLQNRRTR